MSTLEELDDLDRRDRDDKEKKNDKDKKSDKDKDKESRGPADGDAEMKDAQPEEEDVLDEEILSLSTQDILTRRRLLENDSRIMKSEFQRLSHEKATMGEKIKENLEKIANNRYAPQRVMRAASSRLTVVAQTTALPRRQRRGTARP